MEHTDTEWGESVFGLRGKSDQDLWNLHKDATGLTKQALWEAIECRRTIRGLNDRIKQLERNQCGSGCCRQSVVK